MMLDTLHLPECGPKITTKVRDEIGQEFTPLEMRKLMNSAIRKVAGVVIGSSDNARMTMAGIMAGQNILFWGGPGNGKSFLCETMMSVFDNSFSKFSIQTHADMSPDAILGVNPVRNLLDGDDERILTGRIGDSNLVFVDEVLKANSVVHSSLMSVFCEKRLYNGGKYVSCPLISVMATCNESKASTAGFLSRFGLKINVERLGNADELEMLSRKNNVGKVYRIPENFGISMQQLYWARYSAMSMVLPQEFVNLLQSYARALRVNGVDIDTRHVGNALLTCKALAWLDGGPSHCFSGSVSHLLPSFCCPNPDDIVTARAVWNTLHKNGLIEEASTSTSPPDDAFRF